MHRKSNFFTSSVGQKIVMSLTGIFLCTFLIIHLIGNLSLFKNDNGVSFNSYSHFMSTNPIIRTIEIFLFLGFGYHIIQGLLLWNKNRKARPKNYSVYEIEETTTLTNRISVLSGVVILFFLVVHLNTFFVPTRFFGSENIFLIVVDSFKNPYYTFFYIFALVLLSFHLRHGFQSAFQTLGLRKSKYIFLIDSIALLFWLIIPIGFAVMPIYFLFFYQ